MPSNSWLVAFLSFCFCVEKAQATSELIPPIPRYNFISSSPKLPHLLDLLRNSLFFFSPSLIHLSLVLDTN